MIGLRCGRCCDRLIGCREARIFSNEFAIALSVIFKIACLIHVPHE
jgi:hypothetical protein